MIKTDPKYFTCKQLKAINLLAAGNVSSKDIAGVIHCNPNTITTWKKDPKFIHAVVMRSRALLKEELPAVYEKLGKDSKAGSAQHIKILLDHLQSLDNAVHNETTLTFTWKEDKGPSDEG